MTLAAPPVEDPGPPPPEDPARGRERLVDALVPFLATRWALLLLTFVGAWTAHQGPLTSWSEFVARWDRWDAPLLRRIAEFGYDGDPALGPDPGLPSFFPGLPIVLRAAHLVVRDYVLAGLVVSLVAGAVAAVALVRLGELEGLDRTARSRAVLYLFAAPYAVFLVAGYTEALFLALALPAWVAAREQRWVAAGLLAGASASVRVTGLFLGIALVVQYVLTVRRPRVDALALLAPFAVVAAYFGYLYRRTGDWLAWTHAQEAGFGRRFTLPWDAFTTTLNNATAAGNGAEYRFSYAVEILFVALGVGLTAVLLLRRRWAESVYVGLSVAALATSTFFYSVSRASLLWWPLYLMLAAAAARRSWVHVAYLAVSLPLLAAMTLTFTAGFWTA